MDKIVLNKEKLVKIAKDNKKLFENYYVKRFAYLVNGKPYYFAIFKKGDKTKGYAVLSPESGNKNDQLVALRPLLHYSVTINNILTDGKYRADVNFAGFYEVRDYLRRVVEGSVLNADLEVIYRRSLSIIQNMIELQESLVEHYKEAIRKYEAVKEKGFITEEDINDIKKYIPLLMRIQYKQYLERYDYRSDFDVIYANRKEFEIKQFDQFTDPRTLKQLTTDIAEKEMKEGLSRLDYGRDLHDMTDEEYDEMVLTEYNMKLDQQLERVKSKLRYP
ncbi:hypothetical protein ACFO3D_10570 [Virgibacillus kekensis]|uniref:Uncharacterized protein n=1 Tax=Virgibacillus kekensis TaxID=202261 RepID=A0ABV9DIK3_9BACI